MVDSWTQGSEHVCLPCSCISLTRVSVAAPLSPCGRPTSAASSRAGADAYVGSVSRWGVAFREDAVHLGCSLSPGVVGDAERPVASPGLSVAVQA